MAAVFLEASVSAFSATQLLLPLSLVMDMLYYKAHLPNRVAFKCTGSLITRKVEGNSYTAQINQRPKNITTLRILESYERKC